MRNVEMNVKQDTLTITVNLRDRHGRSSSGKTAIVACSEGAVPVPGHPDIKINVTAYTKA